MKRVKLWILGHRLDQKWNQVQKNREKMLELLEREVPYTSSELISLDEATARIGYEAALLERDYRRLACGE